jgi:arsenate reductase
MRFRPAHGPARPCILKWLSRCRRSTDLSHAEPRYLSSDLTNDAHIVITMGCGDECPLVPGVERDDWPIADPKEQPVEVVRRIRDDILKRVSELIKERRWA